MGGVGVREGTFQSLCLEINFSSLLTKSPDLTNTISSGLNFSQGVVWVAGSNIPRWQFTVLGVLKKPIMLLFKRSSPGIRSVACELNTGDHLN